jgi:hypothetical protein
MNRFLAKIDIWEGHARTLGNFAGARAVPRGCENLKIEASICGASHMLSEPSLYVSAHATNNSSLIHFRLLQWVKNEERKLAWQYFPATFALSLPGMKVSRQD